jgi:hypothetical protein
VVAQTRSNFERSLAYSTLKEGFSDPNNFTAFASSLLEKRRSQFLKIIKIAADLSTIRWLQEQAYDRLESGASALGLYAVIFM